MSIPKVSGFIVCKYNEGYWVGLVKEVEEEHDDVKIGVYASKLPSKIFLLAKETCYILCANCEC